MIRDNVKGLSFADVGGLWNTTNERVTLAVQSGASRAAMIDLFPETSPWWEKLDARAAERGAADYGRYPSANIDDPTLPERVGTYDSSTAPASSTMSPIRSSRYSVCAI